MSKTPWIRSDRFRSVARARPSTLPCRLLLAVAAGRHPRVLVDGHPGLAVRGRLVEHDAERRDLAVLRGLHAGDDARQLGEDGPRLDGPGPAAEEDREEVEVRQAPLAGGEGRLGVLEPALEVHVAARLL